MAHGAPDYTRITEIKGLSPTATLVTIAVDATGQLYAVVKGQYGSTLVPIAVDSAGRIIMVPYGVTSISGTATVTQAEKDREVQGKDGVTLRTLAVDASGQLIMVPRGQSGNYMAVDASGFLTAVLKGTDAGAVLRSILVDASGQLIMVPRGSTGNYMAVDASGYMTSVMKGVDGVTLRTVAVDSSGKILGVLQGDYDGTLTTLAVDSQGRMLAVLTDPEDVFGNPHYMGAAELAARLGALTTFDRRGQVLLQDDFESGKVKWGTGVDLSLIAAWGGKFSIRFSVPAGVGELAPAATWIPYGTTSVFGSEIAVALPTEDIYFGLYMTLYDGTNYHRGRLRLRTGDNTLQYWTSAGAWAAIAGTYKTYNLPPYFNNLKLVINPQTDKYVRFLLNGLSIDLSAYALQKDLDASAPSLYIAYVAENAAAPAALAYGDNVIITHKES